MNGVAHDLRQRAFLWWQLLSASCHCHHRVEAEWRIISQIFKGIIGWVQERCKLETMGEEGVEELASDAFTENASGDEVLLADRLLFHHSQGKFVGGPSALVGSGLSQAVVVGSVGQVTEHMSCTGQFRAWGPGHEAWSCLSRSLVESFDRSMKCVFVDARRVEMVRIRFDPRGAGSVWRSLVGCSKVVGVKRKHVALFTVRVAPLRRLHGRRMGGGGGRLERSRSRTAASSSLVPEDCKNAVNTTTETFQRVLHSIKSVYTRVIKLHRGFLVEYASQPLVVASVCNPNW